MSSGLPNPEFIVTNNAPINSMEAGYISGLVYTPQWELVDGAALADRYGANDLTGTAVRIADITSEITLGASGLWVVHNRTTASATGRAFETNLMLWGVESAMQSPYFYADVRRATVGSVARWEPWEYAEVTYDSWHQDLDDLSVAHVPDDTEPTRVLNLAGLDKDIAELRRGLDEHQFIDEDALLDRAEMRGMQLDAPGRVLVAPEGCSGFFRGGGIHSPPKLPTKEDFEHRLFANARVNYE